MSAVFCRKDHNTKVLWIGPELKNLRVIMKATRQIPDITYLTMLHAIFTKDLKKEQQTNTVSQFSWPLFLVPLLNHPDTYLTSQESSQEDAVHERSDPPTYTSLQWPIQSRTWIETLIVLIHRKIIPNRVTKSAKTHTHTHTKKGFS